VAVEAAGVRCVAPDTGLVHWLWEDAAGLDRSAVRLPVADGVAATFHGRDVFAPAAARLAAGAALRDLGEEVAAPQLLDAAGVGVDAAGNLVCRVVAIDRFGNVVTTLRRRDLAGARLAGARWGAGGTDLVARTYAEIGDGVALVVGGSGHVEIAADSRSAAELSGLRPGDEVRVRLAREAGAAGVEAGR
jgi:hypothetical protein